MEIYKASVPKPVFRMVVLGLLAIALLKVVYTLLSADKGFDLTDEGCIMLWYSFPDKDPYPFYYFHQMVLGVLPIDWGIAGTRLIKIFNDVLILGLLSLTVYRNVPERYRTHIFAATIIAIVGLGYHSQFFARAYYEGDMSYLFATISLCLPIIFRAPNNKLLIHLALLFSGVFIGLQFFNKFSTSIVCLLLLWAFTIGNRFYLGLLWVHIGAALGGIVFFAITGHSPLAFIAEYKTGYHLVIEPLGYNPLEQLYKYCVEGLILLLFALFPLLIYALVHFMFKPLRGSWSFAVVLVLCFIFVYLAAPDVYSDSHYRWFSLASHFWYAPVISSIIYLFVSNRLWSYFERHQWWLLVVLLVIPFASFIGSGTSLNVSISSYLMPWYAIIAFFSIYSFSGLVLAPITMLSVAAFIFLQVVYPFRLLEPIAAQKEVVAVRNDAIEVDSKLANFVRETQHILNQHEISQPYPIVTLHNLPGLVYLLGAYSPATPWYFEAKWLGVPEIDRQLAEFNRIHLARIKMFEQQPPVFLINEYALAEVEADVLASGFDLANDYLPPKPVYNPYVAQENEMLGRKQSADLLVFIPKPQQ